MKRITQETFDGVVAENQADFDMPLAEAVADAVQQFNSQGVDLSNINTAPRDEGQAKAIVECCTQIQGLAAGAAAAAPDADAVSAAVAALSGLCAATDGGETTKEEAKANAVVAGEQGVVGALARIGQRLVEPPALGVLTALLRAAALVLEGQPDLLLPPPGSPDAGRLADGRGSVAALCAMLTKTSSLPHSDARSALLVAGLHVVRHGCTKHEPNREAFLDAGVLPLVVAAVASDSAGCVAAAAQAMRAFTVDDDIRVPFGQSHEVCKRMATDLKGLELLVAALGRWADHAGATAQLAGALSRLAVRAELCQEIVDLGGLAAVVQGLAAHPTNPRVARWCIQALKALAGNDDVRNAIKGCGGIDLIVSTMQAHLNSVAVAQSGCVALAAVALRNPGNCVAISEANGPHVIVKLMHVHADASAVQQSACRALRNIVVRNRELAPLILAENAEEYINKARARHKRCDDDAKAALRDLGCKVELVERWTGDVRAPGAKGLDLDGTRR